VAPADAEHPAVPPRVAILLPARDAAATLPACLHSIRRQTFSDFRCVLVDDGSADGTLALARAAAADDRRLHVVAAPRRGLVAALQCGLGHCDGELIARMDADDVMHRDRLALQVAALDADASLSGIGCRVRLFPTTAVGAGMTAYGRWLGSIVTPADVQREAFVECPIVHPTLLLRGDVLRRFGYRDFDGPEDYDLVLRLLQAGHRLAVLPRTLHAWRRSRTAATVTDPRYAAARFPALKAAGLAAGFLRDSRHYVLWGFGGTGRALRKALLAHDRRPAFVVELHPRRLGTTIHGAPVIPPQQVPVTGGLPIVVSVAGADNRAIIRAQLAAMQRQELRDYVVTA
jgi:glycosyltransferase involved in cell wall biosynthesis